VASSYCGDEKQRWRGIGWNILEPVLRHAFADQGNCGEDGRDEENINGNALSGTGKRRPSRVGETTGAGHLLIWTDREHRMVEKQPN
jgi:hypothetical protein